MWCVVSGATPKHGSGAQMLVMHIKEALMLTPKSTDLLRGMYIGEAIKASLFRLRIFQFF